MSKPRRLEFGVIQDNFLSQEGVTESVVAAVQDAYRVVEVSLMHSARAYPGHKAEFVYAASAKIVEFIRWFALAHKWDNESYGELMQGLSLHCAEASKKAYKDREGAVK